MEEDVFVTIFFIYRCCRSFVYLALLELCGQMNWLKSNVQILSSTVNCVWYTFMRLRLETTKRSQFPHCWTKSFRNTLICAVPKRSTHVSSWTTVLEHVPHSRSENINFQKCPRELLDSWRYQNLSGTPVNFNFAIEFGLLLINLSFPIFRPHPSTNVCFIVGKFRCWNRTPNESRWLEKS